MSTVFSQVAIGGADRRDDVLRLEVQRTLNSVGSWMAILRNIGDAYNGVFDVQDQFLVDINGLANTLMQGRVDGPAVTRIGKDLESDWDEYVIVRGVDQAQDLLFHNDFDHDYPDTRIATQQLKTVLNDVINVQLTPALTNITYVPPMGATPLIGAVEFREGASFLGTLQEMFRTAGWLFYVDDVLALQSGAPGFDDSGVILQSIAGDPSNNIIDMVEILERDGDKLYNYVKLYGKNPMFDGYTELNAADNTISPHGDDDATTIRVGTYSQVAWNNDPVDSLLEHIFDPTVYNYPAGWDMSKGEIGVWGYYDNEDDVPGTPGVGAGDADMYVECILTDDATLQAKYFGEPSHLYLGDWGFCTFPLGEKFQSGVANLPDQWCLAAGDFNWRNVMELEFTLPRSGLAGHQPSHFYIDGITMPEPCIAIVEDAVISQPAYRRRPYVDSFPNFQTQISLQAQADRFLDQHKETGVNQIKLVTPGDVALHYAGQTVTLDIPALGLNTALAYMTEIHHIIEPYSDISNGFGFDWITEVTATPINGTVYDMGRLRDGPTYSAMQLGNRAAVGTRIK